MQNDLFTVIRSVPIEYLLLVVGVLIFTSVVASKLSNRLGVPALLLFLIVGFLFGSDGPGGLYFDDPWLAQLIGTAALAIILFGGGLSTDIKYVRPIVKEAAVLATVGVLFTALLTGLFAKYFLGLSTVEAMLLGSIMSSTDAAAVFMVLRSRNAALKGQLAPLLELESGVNDPMAIFLTFGFVQLLSVPDARFGTMLSLFFSQLCLGLVMGVAFGYIVIYLLNHIKLEYEGIYPVFLLALVLIAYALTASLQGSGFLTVYIMGLVMGNKSVIHKRSLSRFFDAMTWLSQIALFLTLGLLVFPSQLVSIIGIGFALSFFLMIVARPVSVFATMIFSRMTLCEKVLISWVGLRGAVPVVLATIPLLAGVPSAPYMFNLVFFVVLTSALLQGTTIPLAARLLGVGAELPPATSSPLELRDDTTNNVLEQVQIAAHSAAAGKEIVNLGLPAEMLIVLIERGNQYIVPTGNTLIEAEDRLMLLGSRELVEQAKNILAAPAVAEAL
jgi:cell volume regulation protein A